MDLSLRDDEIPLRILLAVAPLEFLLLSICRLDRNAWGISLQLGSTADHGDSTGL